MQKLHGTGRTERGRPEPDSLPKRNDRQLFRLFSEEIRRRITADAVNLLDCEEIRLRVRRGIVFCRKRQKQWLTGNEYAGADRCGDVNECGSGIKKENRYRMTEKDMEIFLASCSEHSLYAFSDQLKNGYLTIRGGHRIGFAGSLIMQEENIQGFLGIGSASIRVAHEVKGCGTAVLPELFDQGRYCNTLILSPPGRGKTTLLRDLIRLLSEGSLFGPPMNVAVSDERGELGACYGGCPEFDLGPNTDILDGGRKEKNLRMMLRSLSPELLAMDEIGEKGEEEGLLTANQWGVGLLASMHGSMEDGRSTLPGFVRIFERYIEPIPAPFGWSYRIFDRDGNERIRTDAG